MQMGVVSKCKVCAQSESKYKCPICLIPYCSLPCYRTHKQTPCSKEEPASPKASGENGQPLRPFELDEDDESGWRLRRNQLEALAASDDVRRMLRDQDLQQLIRKIDSSITPEKELDKAMQGPAFKEFADKIMLV